LDIFVNDVGIPNRLTYDGAGEQAGKGTKFHESVRHYRINDHTIEPYSPWQNRAETGIRIMKSKGKRMMMKRQVPLRLWDFALVWISQVYTRSATKGGRTGFEIITGDTPDISEWLDFTFYNWVWYWHPPDTSSNPHVGRWLGVSHRVGSALCYWILTANGNVVARTTVQHLTEEELQLDETKSRLSEFNTSIHRFLGSPISLMMTNLINLLMVVILMIHLMMTAFTHQAYLILMQWLTMLILRWLQIPITPLLVPKSKFLMPLV
jgi:hypothetical protein